MIAVRLYCAPALNDQSGIFVCVPLDSTADEARVLAAAREEGFALDGVQANVTGLAEPGLVIGFAACSEPTLRRALRRLHVLMQ
jgi:DNA-binding transcriptional MocR family regulator